MSLWEPKILFNFPSKGRPEKFRLCLHNLEENISDKDNCHFLFKFEKRDKDIDHYIKYYSQFELSCDAVISDCSSKVEAINKGINHIDYDWDILVNWSDDMFAVFKSFDDFIRNVFKTSEHHFDLCPCFWDGYRPDDLITLAVMGRTYYNRFKCIYNHAYKSVYCDNEMTEVAKILNRFVFIKEPQIIVHRHPNNDKTIAFDEGYRNSESYYKEDLEVFKNRALINFTIS